MGSNVQLQRIGQRNRLAIAEVRKTRRKVFFQFEKFFSVEEFVMIPWFTPIWTCPVIRRITFCSVRRFSTIRIANKNTIWKRFDERFPPAPFRSSKVTQTEQCASLELEVPLPKCVIEASTGFRREYTLEQSRDKQVEEELTWSVESNIRVSSRRDEEEKRRSTGKFRFRACRKRRLNWLCKRTSITARSKSNLTSSVKFASNYSKILKNFSVWNLVIWKICFLETKVFAEMLEASIASLVANARRVLAFLKRSNYTPNRWPGHRKTVPRDQFIQSTIHVRIVWKTPRRRRHQWRSFANWWRTATEPSLFLLPSSVQKCRLSLAQLRVFFTTNKVEPRFHLSWFSFLFFF